MAERGGRTRAQTSRAVFFDLGGVLFTGPFQRFREYEREHGLEEGFLVRVNSTNPSNNALARLERGEIDLDEFDRLYARESATLGHEVPGRVLLQLMVGAPIPRMLRAVEKVSERFETGLLTNDFPFLDREPMLRELEGMFDVVVRSSRVGLRKPDPDFYLLACEMAGVHPTEVVFLDDIGVNLKAARALGMRTIKVTEPDDALEELSHVLGMHL